MGLCEYDTEPPRMIFQFRILTEVKADMIGTYTHPVMRRMKYFYYYHGKEFENAISKFYKRDVPDFNSETLITTLSHVFPVVIAMTRDFISQRLQEISANRGKSKAVAMYHKYANNFSLLFCRDLFAIMQYKNDYYKFERLENFLCCIHDPTLHSLKDAAMKAFFQ